MHSHPYRSICVPFRRLPACPPFVCCSHREEARAKGVAARRRMVERYSPEVLAQELAAHLRRIDALIPALPPPV